MIKHSFTLKIVPFKQMLTVNMYINIPYFFLPKCQGYYKKINRTGNYVYKQDHMQENDSIIT